MTHPQNNDGKSRQMTLYFPSPVRLALPKFAAISLLLIVAANVGSLTKTGDWSATSLKIHSLTTLILLVLLFFILLIVFYTSKIISAFLIIDNDSLVFIKMGKAREYSLDSIKSFVFETSTVLDNDHQEIDVEVFGRGQQDEKKPIYFFRHHYRLLGAWKKTALMLEKATGKKVAMVFHMLDSNGQVIDTEII
jgi:hypothetical protein